jgi:hypothetical protein
MTEHEEAARLFAARELLDEFEKRMARRAKELFEIAELVRRVANDAKGTLVHELSLMRLSHRLTGRKMVGPEQILGAAVPMDSFPGVYFLIRQGKIVYVGQSKNVFYRVSQHAQRQTDRWAFVPCELEELDVVESLYIHLIRPEDNGRTADGTMNAPLSIETLFELMMAGSKVASPPGAEVEDC